jgi:hypothetical protein
VDAGGAHLEAKEIMRLILAISCDAGRLIKSLLPVAIKTYNSFRFDGLSIKHNHWWSLA